MPLDNAEGYGTEIIPECQIAMNIFSHALKSIKQMNKICILQRDDSAGKL